MWARCDPDDEWDHFLARVLAGGAVPRRFPIDAIRRSDRVEGCDLPGVDPSSIAVTVDDDVPAIRAERAVVLEAGEEVLELDRGQGVVGRDVAVSPMLDVSRVGAVTRPACCASRSPSRPRWGPAVEPARPLGGQPRSGTPGRGVLG